MIPERTKELLIKLKDKSESGQAIWSKTSVDTEFKLEFQKGAVTIDNWEDSHGIFADFAIINDNGDIIERHIFNVNEDPDDYNFISNIYKSVKNSYYKTDETIKTIFDELDSEKTIGKDKRRELPF